MAKNDFLFAPSNRIEYLMNKFEVEFLAKCTPCHYSDVDELSYALGIIHVELILIHPFREGNGRVARLLADLMSMQSKKATIKLCCNDQKVMSNGAQKTMIYGRHSRNADFK